MGQVCRWTRHLGNLCPLVSLSFGGGVCALLRLSGPLKKQFALVSDAPVKLLPPGGVNQQLPLTVSIPQEQGLDFERLLDASEYKETYRAAMIRWGEEKRSADPGFFCRLIVEGVTQPLWVRDAIVIHLWRAVSW